MARRTSASAAHRRTATKAQQEQQSRFAPGTTWGTDDDMDFCPARRDDIPDDEQDYPPSPYMIDDEPYIIFD